MSARPTSPRRNMGLMALLAFFLLACTCGLPFGRGTPANPNLAGADFGQIVMAGAIGQDNAPQDTRNEFRTSDPIIYVVADVNRVAQGTTVFARWSREGQPYEDSPPITADRDYTDTYLEFHLQPTGNAFESGSYSVQIYVNGNPGPETSFTIR